MDTLPTESYVSPLCIEGDARYISMMDSAGVFLDYAWAAGDEEWLVGSFPFGSLSGLRAEQSNLVSQASSLPWLSPEDVGGAEIKQSAGSRWYADLPLDPYGKTTALVSFQNEALIKRIEAQWVPYNLLEHDGETITIRAGDSLKFTSRQDDAWFGSFSLAINGEERCSQQLLPEICTFTNTGIYMVSGTFSTWSGSESGEVAVKVIEGSFPEESPACLVGRERQWSFEGMPSNIVYEVDDSVELDLLSRAANVTNQSSIVTKVALRATDTNGDHTMLTRLYEVGPILDSTQLDTFWIQNATDGYFWTVETYEDSELWEVLSVAKNVPDSVDVQIKVIVGGVTLDDYTLERWLTNTAYNDIGEYNFRLFHPNDEQASTCHTFKLYQDGEFIGDAFSGGQDDIETE